MKKVTSILKSNAQKFWQDESAQGATEYILLLVVIVGLSMMFRNQIRAVIEQKISQLGSDIGGF